MRASTPAGSATGSRPKTRTEPDWALSRPSRCLISVVLPAPLAPTRPKTVPRGRLRLTPSRASFAPNRRVRPRTSTTGSARGKPLAIMALFLLGARLHDGGALAQHLKDLFDADVQ